MELNIPPPPQAVLTEFLMNISFEGDTRGRIIIEKESNTGNNNIFVFERECNNSLTDSKDEYSQRTQSVKVKLYSNYNKLKIRKEIEANFSISLVSKTFGCPPGSEFIIGVCTCSEGHYQIAGISDFICFQCPTYCKSCNAENVQDCPLKTEYLEC